MPFPESCSFSQKQKRGLLLLASLMLLGQGLQQTVPYFWPAQPFAGSFPQLFQPDIPSEPIDLNLADSTTLRQLPGIGKVLSKRIIRYRERIGGYDSLSQLKKVYGIRQELAEQLIPLLTLSPYPSKPSTFSRPEKRNQKRARRYSSYKNSAIPTLDINTASAEDFALLPGIGPVLSQRIIKFRNAKGHFAAIDDIARVYQLPDSTWKKIRPYLKRDSLIIPNKQNAKYQAQAATQKFSIPAGLQAFDINRADSSTWVQVPGIDAKLVLRITAYQKLIGFFAHPTHLQKVYGFPTTHWEEIKPYLKVEEIEAFPKLDLNTLPKWKVEKYPFWKSGEAEAFSNLRSKLRRIDSWEEIKGISPESVEYLKRYFYL